MKLRHLAAWFSGVALLGTGATLLCAQPQQSPRDGPVRTDREKLRAKVIKLRTEVEMLRFDYELARDGVLEEVKLYRSLNMAAGLMSSVSVIQQAVATPPGPAPRQKSAQDRKEAAEADKAALQAEKKNAAELAAFVAEQKKELTRQFALLAETRLHLADAERSYRESSP